MSTTGPTDATSHAPIVIDLGKQKKKEVRRLTKGSGRLMDDIEEAVAELRSSGAVADDVVPLIVVVREKRRKRGFLGM